MKMSKLRFITTRSVTTRDAERNWNLQSLFTQIVSPWQKSQK